jgi:hypothetical protein
MTTFLFSLFCVGLFSSPVKLSRTLFSFAVRMGATCKPICANDGCVLCCLAAGIGHVSAQPHYQRRQRHGQHRQGDEDAWHALPTSGNDDAWRMFICKYIETLPL